MAEKKKNSITAILLIVAILLMVCGTMRGEVKTMFKKSVNICMECIGIG